MKFLTHARLYLTVGAATFSLLAGPAIAQNTSAAQTTAADQTTAPGQEPRPAPHGTTGQGAPEKSVTPTLVAPSVERKQSVGEYTADAVITTKIKASLLAESEVSALDIKVETTDGVVHLTGVVDNDGQVRIAERIARETDNVKNVVNDLRVEPLPK